MPKYKIWLIIILILAISIPASIPLLRGDFFHFSDEPNVSLIYEMYRAFSSGQLPPRWAPDISYEYGYPLFNFYYVLPFYIGALFFSLLGSLITAIKITFLITIPLSAVAMFFWLRQHASNFVSFVGALIYVYTPYRAVDLYVRGAIGETFSFVFFPLVALLTHLAVNKKDLRFVGLLGLGVGLFLLTHNLAPLFFLPWAFVYGLILAFKKFDLKKILRLSIGYLLGFLASSYFWLPAFLEKNLLFSETPFNYEDHFPFIKQLIYSPWGYGASLWGPADDLSFQIGIVNWILVIIAILVLIGKLKRRSKNFYVHLFFVLSFAFFVFLMNIRSRFLWEASSFSNYIQFPWRLLMLTTFLTASLVIFVKKARFNKLILTALGLLAILINISYFKPSEYYSPDDDYFMRRFFARRTTQGRRGEFSEEYINYSEDFLLLPLWTTEKPKKLPEGKFTSDDLNILSIDRVNPVRYRSTVDPKNEGLLEFHSYYFPGWYATADGNPVKTEPLEPYGNIGIKIPKGSTEIDVYWKETPLRKMADVISILAFVGIGAFIITGKRKLIR